MGDLLQRRKDGWIGWALVAAVILAWDLYAEIYQTSETMSSAYYRADLKFPITITGVTLITVCHLQRKPEIFSRIDPFKLMALNAQKVAQRREGGTS